MPMQRRILAARGMGGHAVAVFWVGVGESMASREASLAYVRVYA